LIAIISGREVAASEPVPAKPERRAMTSEERERVVKGLAAAYQPRVVETLKTLEADAEKIKFENESGVMRQLVTRIATVENDERGYLAFRVVNRLLDIEPSNLKAWWARQAHSIGLSQCLQPRPYPVASEALWLLARAPEERDLGHVEPLLRNWPEDLYRMTKPVPWLKSLRKEFRREVDEMLHDLVDPSVPAEVQARARELLDILRQSA
jgi:hypothetical protein